MTKQSTFLGFILPEALYTAEEARSRLKMGAHAWRQLRRNGLRVLYVGSRSYVLGKDIIEHFAKVGTDRWQ